MSSRDGRQDIAHLFVYGTLRRAARHPMHRVLARHGVHVGTGRLPGRLHELGGYPGLVLAEQDDGAWAGGMVVGEVWRLHDVGAALAVLDRYEGCAPGSPRPHEYERVVRPVQMDDGGLLPAWVYVYRWPVHGRPLIAGGDYVAWLRSRRR